MNVNLLIPLFFIIGLWIAVASFGHLLDFVIEKGSGRGVQSGPWKTHLGVGRSYTPRIEKAAIARIGLGANDSDETIYWNAFTDSDGNELRSEHVYRILFREAPPIRYRDKGFWSITVYGRDKFLVPNPYKRYMVNSHARGAPGNETPSPIHLSRNLPDKMENWIPLPATDEKFSIAFRCYRPKKEMVNNVQAVVMPDIQRM